MTKEKIPQNANEIKFVQTKDLIEELASRFDTSIFVASNNETKDRAALGWHSKGDYFTLLGLIKWIEHRIDEMEPEDPNEQP